MRLSHIDQQGRASMVDVGDKTVTQRTARAEGFVCMEPDTLSLIVENGLKKGDVLAVARIAGIQAAKRCAELIPLCHPLMLNVISVEFTPEQSQQRLRIESTCRVDGKTGVEMEALTAVSVAALTVYDMCKAVDKSMRVEGVRVIEKKGGRSGDVYAE